MTPGTGEASSGRNERERCEVCGRGYAVWFARSVTWNEVMRDGDRGTPDRIGMICPTCFTLDAEAHGVRPTAWMVLEEDMTLGEHLLEQLNQSRSDRAAEFELRIAAAAERDAALADAARLREERDEARAAAADLRDTVPAWMRKTEDARAEASSLRDALREIAERDVQHSTSGPVEIRMARAALAAVSVPSPARPSGEAE